MRILIIEDEPDIRESIAQISQLENHQPILCTNGTDGIKAAIKHQPDIILCDILMPEVNGYDVIKKLKENNKTALIPFIFITAKPSRQDQRKGMELGADDYLIKPFSRDELLHSIATRNKKSRAIESYLEEQNKKIIYAIPHELKTPLNGILNMSKFIVDDFDHYSKSEIIDFAESIFLNGTRLHNLIKKYLLYLRLELQKEKYPDSFEYFTSDDLKLLVKNISQKYNRENDVNLDIENCVLEVSMDWNEFAIYQLIDNAFKFSEKNTKVIISCKLQKQNLVIIIRDHGRGFPPGTIDKINTFKQFEREKYEQQGIGLGLFLAKKLTLLNNGTFTIKSKTNEGASIKITMPNFEFSI
jgi:signal transduction histidine kinase